MQNSNVVFEVRHVEFVPQCHLIWKKKATELETPAKINEGHLKVK